MNKILEIKNLSKSYGSKKILNNVDLTIAPGEIVGLIGKNGAGKTTLMKIILGLSKPNQGQIKFLGQENYFNNQKIMRNIGYLLDCKVYEYMNGLDNLYLHEKYAGKNSSKKQIQANLKDILNFVELPLDNKKVKGYSFGMKQRLGLALSLLGQPKFLILDEPFVGLDPIGVKKFRDLIHQLSQEQGVTILISSHQLAEVEKICHRFLYINNENIVEYQQSNDQKTIIIDIDDFPENLKDSIKTIAEISQNTILIKQEQIANFNKIIKILVQNDLDIADIKIKTDNLENIFTN
jgi:ABC-2 type transport system ATP-binding protein